MRLWAHRTFINAVVMIDPSSTPGICDLTRFGSSNGEILGWDGEKYDTERVNYLELCVEQRITDLLNGELTADPIKVFIKQEPHKKLKLEEGRLRLISAISLVDTVVDRMLLTDLFQNVITTVGDTPILIGWSPVNSGTIIANQLLGNQQDYLAIDKSAWDWTFPGWMVNSLRHVIQDLHPDAPRWWLRLLRMRFLILFRHAIFRFPKGPDIPQQEWGIMKSGCYWTILLNSMAQYYLHVLVSKRLSVEPSPIIILGDDTSQVPSDKDAEYISILSSLGFKIKHHFGGLEFCGFLLGKYDYLPAYKDKHSFLFKYLTNDEEKLVALLRSYQLLYYHDRESLTAIRSVIKKYRLNKAFVHDARLRQIVDG